MVEGERRAGAVAQQPFAPGQAGACDAHRRIEREAAAMVPAAHRVSITLLEQAAAHEGAQHPPAHPGLHRGQRGRSQPGGFVKHHPRGPIRGAGSREYPIADAAMKTKFQCRLTSVLSTLSEAAAAKVQMGVERRAEAVDEDHRPQPGRSAAAGAVRTQGTRDGAQQDAHDHALQRRIVMQEIAQPLGYRKHHRPACLGFRFAASNCRSGNGGNT